MNKSSKETPAGLDGAAGAGGWAAVMRLFRCRGLFIALGLLLLPAAARAGEATLLLAPPSGPVTAGSRASVWLYFLNDAPGTVSLQCERSYAGRMRWDAGDSRSALEYADLRLSLAEGSVPAVAIAAGTFLKLRYDFTVPPGATGKAVLAVDGFSPVGIEVVDAVVIPRTPAAEAAGPGAPKEEGPAAIATAGVAVDEPAFGTFLHRRVSAYEPIFFLFGTAPSAEFQFSLKARLIDQPEWPEFVNRLFFGYTQTSFWTLLTADPYFYDSSYKPSFFYYKPSLRIPDFTGKRTHLGVQYGYEHESNGKGSTDERSLNTLYFQPTLTLGAQDGWHVTLQPRASYYLSVGQYDRNLAAYKGYVSLRAMLTRGDGNLQVSSRFTLGDRGDHASGLVDLTFKLPKTWGWQTALQIEAFRGYDQNLIDYDNLRTGLRAGVNLWYPKFDGKPTDALVIP